MVGENGSRNTGAASSYSNLGGRYCARFFIGRRKMRIKEVIVIKNGRNLCAQIYGTCDDIQGTTEFKLQLQYQRNKRRGHYRSPISDWKLINIPAEDLPEIIQDDLLSCPEFAAAVRNPKPLECTDRCKCTRVERRAESLNFTPVDDILYGRGRNELHNIPVYIKQVHA